MSFSEFYLIMIAYTLITCWILHISKQTRFFQDNGDWWVNLFDDILWTSILWPVFIPVIIYDEYTRVHRIN